MALFSENQSPWLTLVQQQAQPGQPAAGMFRLFLTAANTLGLVDSSGHLTTLGAAGTNGTDGIDGLPGTDGTNGVGVPAGGAQGQVLAKKSATDYDTGWTASGIGEAPVDGNTYARNNAEWVEVAGGNGLSGGTAGQVLQKYDDGNGDFGWRTLNLNGGGGGGGGSGGVFDLSVGVPPLAAFTKFDPNNLGTYSEVSGKVINIKQTGANPGGANIFGLFKPVPGGSSYIISIYCVYGTNCGNYNGINWGWHDPVSGKYDSCRVAFEGTAGTAQFQNQVFSDPSTRTGNQNLCQNPIFNGPFWLHLYYDGTTIKWGWSNDGFTPFWAFSAPLSTSYLGAGNYTNAFISIFPDGEAGINFQNALSLSLLCWDENGANRDYTTLG